MFRDSTNRVVELKKRRYKDKMLIHKDKMLIHKDKMLIHKDKMLIHKDKICVVFIMNISYNKDS